MIWSNQSPANFHRLKPLSAYLGIDGLVASIFPFLPSWSYGKLVPGSFPEGWSSLCGIISILYILLYSNIYHYKIMVYCESAFALLSWAAHSSQWSANFQPTAQFPHPKVFLHCIYSLFSIIFYTIPLENNGILWECFCPHCQAAVRARRHHAQRRPRHYPSPFSHLFAVILQIRRHRFSPLQCDLSPESTLSGAAFALMNILYIVWSYRIYIMYMSILIFTFTQPHCNYN